MEARELAIYGPVFLVMIFSLIAATIALYKATNPKFIGRKGPGFDLRGYYEKGMDSNRSLESTPEKVKKALDQIGPALRKIVVEKNIFDAI